MCLCVFFFALCCPQVVECFPPQWFSGLKGQQQTLPQLENFCRYLKHLAGALYRVGLGGLDLERRNSRWGVTCLSVRIQEGKGSVFSRRFDPKRLAWAIYMMLMLTTVPPSPIDVGVAHVDITFFITLQQFGSLVLGMLMRETGYECTYKQDKHFQRCQRWTISASENNNTFFFFSWYKGEMMYFTTELRDTVSIKANFWSRFFAHINDNHSIAHCTCPYVLLFNREHIKEVMKLLCRLNAVDHVIAMATEYGIKDIKPLLEGKWRTIDWLTLLAC